MTSCVNPLTLEDMVAEAALHKVLVSNLCQLSDGTWRCNLRSDDGEYCYGYCDAMNPSDAFRGAIRDMHRPGNKFPITKAPPPRTVQFLSELKPPKGTKIKGGDNLLDLLGLG